MGQDNTAEDRTIKYVSRLLSIAYDTNGNATLPRALLLIPLYQ